MSDARVKLGDRQAWFAGVYGACAVLFLLFALVTGVDRLFISLLAAMMGALAALFLRGSRRNKQASAAVNAVNGAYAHLVAGREAEAEASLAAAAALSGKRPYLLRAVAVQRALLAMRRGQLEEAVRWATAVQEGKPRWATKLAESVQIVEGRSFRALAQASLGRADEALADARAVESSPFLSPSSLARISLARAVVLAKSGREDELQAHFAAEGELLVEELGPRERMLSRALRRLGQPRARSVYREAGMRDEPGDDAARDWVRKIAPDAARFVPRITLATADDAGPVASYRMAASPPPTAMPEPAAPGMGRRARGALVKGRMRVGRIALLWAVLIGIFVALWSALEPSPGASSSVASNGGAATLVLPLAFVFAMLFVVGRVWSRRRRQRRWLETVQQALLRLARGEGPAALAEVERAAESGGGAYGPTSYLTLARAAMRRGDAAKTLSASTSGLTLARSTLVARAAHQDIVTPELLGFHAFACASLGRMAEAETDLAAIATEHPSFAYRARAVYRVKLIAAVRAGDLGAAAQVVAAREPEMQLELGLDLLGEIVCAAAAGGLPDEAAEALRSELAAMPRVASWIEQVAPGLTARIGRAHAVRLATPFVSRSDALREEDTVRLDEEAAQLIALGARRPRS
jgi:hypothetical protein